MSAVVAVTLAYVLIVGDSVLLATTRADCKAWTFEREWQRMGYRTKCFDGKAQRAITHRYCERRPLHRIQYSDISRLLLLYNRGGWYVDSDVRPTARCSWLTNFSVTTFGLESNFDERKAASMGMLPKSLSMWSIYGVKGDERLKEMACSLAQQSTRPIRAGESWVSYVHHTSGPTAYTKLWNGKTLGIEVFGCGQSHSHSPPCSEKTCWGCHLFANSWI